MRNKKPPFEITNKILSDIIEIGELVGRVSMDGSISASPVLRRANRIRTVYSSVAIEQNTLSLEQVTAVLEGKRVLAPPKDIAEVKNAYEIYEHMEQLDPYSMDDLLVAHSVMVRELTAEAGQFRSRPVGVVDSEGRVLHFGTLPQNVPSLVAELLDWVRDSEVHMLIKSCVFHYELELIHPFADGNGRIGRLWHTLLLSKWKPVFAWLPVESIIHNHQAEYYAAINASNDAAESTAFIEFMLSVIKEALLEAVGSAAPQEVRSANKQEMRWKAVYDFLRTHDYIQSGDVQTLLGVSPATANRILSGFAADGRLEKLRVGSHWGYQKI